MYQHIQKIILSAHAVLNGFKRDWMNVELMNFRTNMKDTLIIDYMICIVLGECSRKKCSNTYMMNVWSWEVVEVCDVEQ